MLIATAVAAAAVALAVAFVAVPHANAVETGRWYVIESRSSGLVLDVDQGSTANGAGLVQWSDTGATNQQFRFLDAGGGYYRIQARHSGKVVDVAESSTANGAEIVQWDDHGGTNQQWQVDESGGYATFINRASGKALDVWEWSSEAGTRISQYDPTGGENQQWTLNPTNNDSGNAGDPYGYLFAYMLGEGSSNGEQIYFALSRGDDPWRTMRSTAANR
ncbi:hypothetical protein GCM10029992_51320 [Glycomyces albus]